MTLLPSTTARQGNSLTLDCQPAGNPPPTVSWLRDGAAVTESSRVSVDDSGRLVFTSVFSTDAGGYTCLASNSIGSASANTVLIVLGMCVCVCV